MDTRNNRILVRVVAGMTIAAIALELPVLAVPQPAPMLMAQKVVACVVSKSISAFKTADPKDPEVLPNRFLKAGTAVALTQPLPTVPPARVQINPSGFIDFAALDCGSPTSPGKTTACRAVKDTISSATVFQVPNNPNTSLAAVGAGQPVYVRQTAGVTNSQLVNGGSWVEVDLQQTFGRNFGVKSLVGFLSNTQPGVPGSTLAVSTPPCP